MREEFYAGLEDRKYLPLVEAQKRALKVDWAAPKNAPVRPQQLGTVVYEDFPLQEVVPYIDWNPFFQVWPGCEVPWVFGALLLWSAHVRSMKWKNSFPSILLLDRSGSCGAATPTAASPRSSTMRPWGGRRASCLTRHRPC